MSEAPRVEDSHAKLAAEMRRVKGGAEHPGPPRCVCRWCRMAARVEALGRVEEKKAAFSDDDRLRIICAMTALQSFRDTHDGEHFRGAMKILRALVESESKKEDAG